MTTTGYINGLPLGWQAKKVRPCVRLIKNETPGRFGVSLDSFEEGGLDITLDVIAFSKTERDQIVAAFMALGRSYLSLGGDDVGWYYSGKCGDRSTDLAISDWIPEETYPLSFLFCTDKPFMYSEKAHVRARSLTQNGETWTTDNIYADNIVQNWSFVNWSAGTSGVAPDEWTLGTAGTGVSRGQGTVNGQPYYYVTVTPTGNQYLGEIRQPIQLLPGVEYTFGCLVKIDNRNSGVSVLEVYTDAGSAGSVTYFATTDWRWISFTHIFDSPPTNPVIRTYVAGTPSSPSLHHFDQVTIVETGNFENVNTGNSLVCSGTVPSVPDVIVTGVGVGTGTINQTGGNTTQTINDATVYTNNATSWTCIKTVTIPAVSGIATLVTGLSLQYHGSSSSYTAYAKYTIQTAGLYSGAEHNVNDFGKATTATQTCTMTTLKLQATTNTTVTLRWYAKVSNASNTCTVTNCSYTYTGGFTGSSTVVNVFPSNVQIYNTLDTTTRLNVCNVLYPGASYRLNAEGTGYFKYQDDFDNNVYSLVCSAQHLVTYSSVNKNVTIADGGYLVYPFDVKYPIIGIPYLMLFVESGAPHISFQNYSALDSDTAYYIDNYSTVSQTNTLCTYDLICTGYANLTGSTRFDIRIHPTDGHNLVISSIYLVCGLGTIDASHPIIVPGVTNQYKILMDNDAACNVALIYPDRVWGI